MARKTITVTIKVSKWEWIGRWGAIILYYINWKHWGGGLLIKRFVRIIFSTSGKAH